MTALTTLKSINTQLDVTSNRVSTGQRVSSAADNAAYWSIATTVRTDNGSLGAVKDSLGLGSATVDTAYTGLTSVLSNLQNMRSKLQAALTPGVDRSKVQTEIKSLQDNMKSTADSSIQSGQNWLSVNSSDTSVYKATQSIVAGFSRDITGHISFSTVDVEVSDIQLYDKSLTATAATSAKITASTAIAGTLDFKTAGDEQSTLTITLGSGESADITLDKASLTAHVKDLGAVTKDELLSAINNSIASSDLAGLVSASLDSAGRLSFETIGNPVTDSVAVNIADGGAGTPIDIGFGVDETVIYNGVGTAATTGTGGGILDSGNTNVAAVAISNSTTDMALKAHIDTVDRAIAKITEAATKLGAAKTQIDGQKSFVDTLMKSNDRAIGILVDADIEEESTKLKALQTQQQLAVQTLSIANSSTQNILSLFR